MRPLSGGEQRRRISTFLLPSGEGTKRGPEAAYVGGKMGVVGIKGRVSLTTGGGKIRREINSKCRSVIQRKKIQEGTDGQGEEREEERFGILWGGGCLTLRVEGRKDTKPKEPHLNGNHHTNEKEGEERAGKRKRRFRNLNPGERGVGNSF